MCKSFKKSPFLVKIIASKGRGSIQAVIGKTFSLKRYDKKTNKVFLSATPFRGQVVLYPGEYEFC